LDVKQNNKAWPTTTCTVQNPPTSGGYTGDNKAVKVTLSVQQILPFSGFFVSTAPTITAPPRRLCNRRVAIASSR
jgi:hypothetical protein